MILAAIDVVLPLTNPVLKFLLILLIILFAPILLNKLRVPPLLGLIMAGAVIGPHGFNLIVRDSSIILSGTAGLLYIMFLAGLEIDLGDFKKNRGKSLTFGLYTFLIPMLLGTLTGLYIFGFSVASAVLLASMFASHTLITYPIVSRLGISKNRAVNITVGGTMITDTLALLVLAVIVGMATGETDATFWTRLSVSLLAFGLVVMLLFPVIGRWFFKHFDDGVSQYIFVLAMVFLGAVLAELAGVEAIIGAFLSGLSLNRLIPRTSPLMNRVNFVGNAIFIPFFLIGVGMLVDYRFFFRGFETIKVAVVMTVVATLAKFLAAWCTQKTFHFSADERRLIFGLSNAQAAATLAAVLVGYNVVLGQTEGGDPIRLLNEDVLNGTILMILVTCTLASFVTQKGAQNIALAEIASAEPHDSERPEKVLISLGNLDTVEELINLGLTVRSGGGSLYALNVVNSNEAGPGAVQQARKILDRASGVASAADNYLHELLRYDVNVVNGIVHAIKENGVTDLIMGLHRKEGITDSFLGRLTEGILTRTHSTVLVYKPAQPLATVKRYLVIVPGKAEREIGFLFWLVKVWNLARRTGARLVFHAPEQTLEYIRHLHTRHPVESDFREFTDWNDFWKLGGSIRSDDGLLVVMSRKEGTSYNQHMLNIPAYLNAHFQSINFILIYPMQSRDAHDTHIDLKNPSVFRVD